MSQERIDELTGAFDDVKVIFAGQEAPGEYIPLQVTNPNGRELFRGNADRTFTWAEDYDKDEAAQALAEAINYLLGAHPMADDSAVVEPVEARFMCGCAASNVEWVRSENNPMHYEHMPLVKDGVRRCPIHGAPVAAA